MNEIEICKSAHTVCSIEDLLCKILAGLPLGSLRLSKSVCKRWSNLITDPRFNELRSRSPKADRPCLLLLHAYSVFDFVPLATRRPISTTSFHFYSENLEVLQSCNGLLLCYDHGPPDKLYVYNPTINQCKLLPLPRNWRPNGLQRYVGLAFDPTLSPHYKLVYPREWSDGRVNVEIYSSETGNWKACAQTDLSPVSFVMFDSRVVYWHGALHWLSRINVYHLSLSDDDDMLQVEEHARLYGITYSARDRLFVSRDCLLLVKILQEPLQLNVYEMKKKNKWSIRYHVNLQSASDVLGPYFNVLAIELGEDPFLVLEDNFVTLIQYNIISNTFHQQCDLTQTRLHQTQYDSFLFTPSLVGL